MRKAEAVRITTETNILMKLLLDGSGHASLETDIPFFTHMLDHLCRHSMFDLELKLHGDLSIDAHHSVEDAGIVLGNLLHESLGDKKGINRYGHCILPMDETLTTVAVDLSGRYHFSFQAPGAGEGKFGVYDAELTKEFLSKLAMHGKFNLHVLVHYGDNRHHIHESIFKALGRALRMAVAIDSSNPSIPSTKGVL